MIDKREFIIEKQSPLYANFFPCIMISLGHLKCKFREGGKKALSCIRQNYAVIDILYILILFDRHTYLRIHIVYNVLYTIYFVYSTLYSTHDL